MEAVRIEIDKVILRNVEVTSRKVHQLCSRKDGDVRKKGTEWNCRTEEEGETSPGVAFLTECGL